MPFVESLALPQLVLGAALCALTQVLGRAVESGGSKLHHRLQRQLGHQRAVKSCVRCHKASQPAGQHVQLACLVRSVVYLLLPS